MKSVTYLLCFVAAAFTAVGCGSNEDADMPKNDPIVGKPSPTSDKTAGSRAGAPTGKPGMETKGGG